MTDVNSAQLAIAIPVSTDVVVMVQRKPKARMIRVTKVFMPSAPTAATKVMLPERNGVMPKPICSSSGSRNGCAPTRPGTEIRRDSDPQRRDFQQRENPEPDAAMVRACLT